jgi:thioredoxin-dependent peroxiredoxin
MTFPGLFDRRSAITLFFTGVLCACSHEPVARSGGGIGLLPVGAQAPDVMGVGNGGKQTRLSDVRGSIAVVYFYPKDETPGCTHEACAFRDAFSKYETRHVVIFGVSRDSEDSHREFRDTHKLPFPLVADEDGSVAQAYGVPSSFRMSQRVTFLIDANGKVGKVWNDVDPGVHNDEVLAAIDAAQTATPTTSTDSGLR